MTKPCLYLQLRPACLANIEDCAVAAADLAERFGISVEFIFNGYRCSARKGDAPSLLVDAYHKACEQARADAKLVKIADEDPCKAVVDALRCGDSPKETARWLRLTANHESEAGRVSTALTLRAAADALDALPEE